MYVLFASPFSIVVVIRVVVVIVIVIVVVVSFSARICVDHACVGSCELSPSKKGAGFSPLLGRVGSYCAGRLI